jgi:hypothetical protein
MYHRDSGLDGCRRRSGRKHVGVVARTIDRVRAIAFDPVQFRPELKGVPDPSHSALKIPLPREDGNEGGPFRA